jgi:hypothetical protein
VAAVAAILSLAPLLLGRVRGLARVEMRGTLFYFSAVGLGFMLLEIAIIEKALLVLGSPTLSVGVVLASVLVGAGLGSLAVRSRMLSRKVFLSVTLAIGVLGYGTILLLQGLYSGFAGQPAASRAILVALLTGSLALLMGVPVPAGIARIRSAGGGVVAWAWGINGFASVLGSLLATMIAMHLGFRVLALVAAVCYLGAGLAHRRLGTD